MIPIFDAHCDTLSRCLECGEELRHNTGHLDLLRGAQFAPRGQFFAIFSDSSDPGPAMEARFEEQYAFFTGSMARNADLAAFCRTGLEAEAAVKEGKTAAFLSVEGAELLGCSLAGLERAFTLGVRAVNLTWNYANPLSGSSAQERDRGLSLLGRQFVRRMGELGMLVDLSHISDPGFWDVMEVNDKPLFASHSCARALFPHQRNLTNGQITAIIERSGVLGLCLYADFLGDDPDIDRVIAHIEHILDLGGARALALGGDWDGCDRLPRGICRLEDLSRLWERMLQKNYGEPLLHAIFYTNLMRVVNQVCTM